MKRPYLVMLLVGVGAVWSWPARADVDVGKGASASDWFRQGNEQFEAGQTVQAYQSYLRAWSLARSFDIACNLGRTEVEIGKTRDAAEHLAFCLKYFAASSRPESRQAKEKFQALFAQVRQAVSEVVLDIEPAGALVIVDTKPMGRSPFDEPLYLSPGAHVLSVELSGYDTIERTLQLERGSAETFSTSLQKTTESAPVVPRVVSAPPGPARDGKEAKSRMGLRTALVAGGGVAAIIGVGVGIGFWIDSHTNEQRLAGLRDTAVAEVGRGGCARDRSPDAESCIELADAASRAHRSGKVATWAFTGASLGAIVSALAYWAWPGTGNESQSRTSSDEPKFSFQLAPAGASGVGFDVTGRF